MIIVLLSSAFRLGCFPISCSAFRASRICFFCSAFSICVLCFGCGTFFYSAFFSCSCFDYAFDSGFCFCRRLCLGSIVAVNCKSNRKYDYCKYEITADAKELFSFLFLLQTFFAMRFFLFITVYFLLAHFNLHSAGVLRRRNREQNFQFCSAIIATL